MVLPEHDAGEGENANANGGDSSQVVTTYLEAESNQRFGIKLMVASGFMNASSDLYAQVNIDGHEVEGAIWSKEEIQLFGADELLTGARSYDGARWIEKPFSFSDLTTSK